MNHILRRNSYLFPSVKMCDGKFYFFFCLHKFHLEYLKIFLTLNIISYYLIKCSVIQINKWKLCIVSSVHLCSMSYYSLPTEVASGFQLCVFLVAGVCWLILIIFLKNKFTHKGRILLGLSYIWRFAVAILYSFKIKTFSLILLGALIEL